MAQLWGLKICHIQSILKSQQWPKLPRVSEKLHLGEYILFTINTTVYLHSDL